ncbi:Proteasome assembly chaperone 2 [Vanrija pseudolonga]|uniref:Proteasome assembly chaperone 2 n=1 Tax=Vanrija pseudolonga TaxID=143232 RepID=A0AAF0YIN5_9TREE|nr:Proteasome assembly chaperone 2 [Vanrija pseudolonga]
MPAATGPLYPVTGFDISSLKGATLIIPSVSLGNVPQLAADLIVSSLGLKRVAFLGTGNTTAPFAGRGEDGLVTGGLELYGAAGQPIFVLLQRAPTLKTKKDAHVELISALAHNYGVDVTLVLTSLDAANQDDAQLLTPHQAVVPPTPAPHPVLGRLAQLPALRLTLETNTRAPAKETTTYPPFLPGAGLTRRILAAVADVPSGAVSAWVVEGDNRGDAHALAAVALGVLGIETQITEPSTWKGLFGSADGWSGGSGLDAEIYG